MLKCMTKFTYKCILICIKNIGKSHMTYNCHSHLHLPFQVLRCGPLEMVSCFPFEGFYKICHSLFHRTRALAEQITRNLSIRDNLSFVHACPILRVHLAWHKKR